MCVDFTYVNKAYPKDNYSMLKIDKLLDTIPTHPLLSFMDAFSQYHQIALHWEDQEKMIFITNRGLYVINLCLSS